MIGAQLESFETGPNGQYPQEAKERLRKLKKK
jgi:hypothetical protein